MQDGTLEGKDKETNLTFHRDRKFLIPAKNRLQGHEFPSASGKDSRTIYLIKPCETGRKRAIFRTVLQERLHKLNILGGLKKRGVAGWNPDKTALKKGPFWSSLLPLTKNGPKVRQNGPNILKGRFGKP